MKDVQGQVDELINWYERFKPEAGKEIPIDCTANDLDFAMEVNGKHWYRGRILLPVGTKPAKKAVVSRQKGQSMAAAFKKAWGSR